MIGVLFKKVTYSILVNVIVSFYKAWKIGKYLDIKSCSCKKRLFGKLLSTSEGSYIKCNRPQIANEKVTYEKNNSLFTVFY